MPRLICPRISPEWELAAQLALVKPKPYTKDKIAHCNPQQPWPRHARRVIEAHLSAHASISFPKTNGERMIADFDHIDPARTKRLARKLSRALPELWFTLDDTIFLRAGVVYQRTGRYNLELVRADRTRLRRAVRFGFFDEVDHAIPRPDHRAREDAPAK